MINVCYILRNNCDKWFELSVDSALLLADRFVFIIDQPDNFTWGIIDRIKALKEVVVLHNKYEHESKQADGLQRSVYLDWLKKYAVGEWALILDDDEVLSDNAFELAKYTRGELGCYDIRMRHVWFCLGLEDSTLPLHLVARRFFRVQIGLTYGLVEHPVLQGFEKSGQILNVQIWHMNVLKGLLSEIAKFKVQCRKSNIHTPDMLKTWHALHICGANPLSRFDLKELPARVREYACINDNGEPVFYEVKK